MDDAMNMILKNDVMKEDYILRVQKNNLIFEIFFNTESEPTQVKCGGTWGYTFSPEQLEAARECIDRLIEVRNGKPR